MEIMSIKRGGPTLNGKFHFEFRFRFLDDPPYGESFQGRVELVVHLR